MKKLLRIVIFSMTLSNVLLGQTNDIKKRFNSLNKKATLPLIYNHIVESEIERYLSFKSLPKTIGLSKFYFPMIEKIFIRSGIPNELKYIAVIESKLIAKAKSRVGALGMWQFMPSTGKMYGLHKTSNTNLFFEPMAATKAAARHLKGLYKEFSNWYLVLSAYNAGSGNVRKAMRKAGSKKYSKIRRFLPKETRDYVASFLAVNYIFEYYESYNIIPHKIIYNFEDLTIVKDVKLSYAKETKHFYFLNPHILTNTIDANIIQYIP